MKRTKREGDLSAWGSWQNGAPENRNADIREFCSEVFNNNNNNNKKEKRKRRRIIDLPKRLLHFRILSQFLGRRKPFSPWSRLPPQFHGCIGFLLTERAYNYVMPVSVQIGRSVISDVVRCTKKKWFILFALVSCIQAMYVCITGFCEARSQHTKS